jgi:hypothetical protein
MSEGMLESYEKTSLLYLVVRNGAAGRRVYLGGKVRALVWLRGFGGGDTIW